MRLIHCRIENFGILSDFDYTFSGGLNVCKEKNGWGKSTLAVFLKVMFFGFANEKKRNALEKERTRYKPWQGGVYGGSITFEAKGKRYFLERVFGDREKDDTFTLYEDDTMLPCTDFSSEIGRELFQVDEQSFWRTCFISQKDCATYATDSIHAKLGDGLESAEELEYFSKAQEKLAKHWNRLTPNRKTGELHKIKAEIEHCKWKLSAKEQTEQSLEECLKALAEKKAEKEKIMEQMGKVKNDSIRHANLAKYEEVSRQYEELEEQLEKMESAFSKGMPTEEEVKEILSIREREREAMTIADSYALTEMEENILSFVKENWEEIPDIAELDECKAELEKQEEEKDPVIEFVKNGLFHGREWMIPIGIALVVTGFFLCFLYAQAGAVFLILGIVGIYFGRKKEKEQEKEEEVIANSKVEAFLLRYPIQQKENPREHLEQIRLILLQLKGILPREKRREEGKELAELCRKDIQDFYTKYSLFPSEEESEWLQDLLGFLGKYHMMLGEFSKISQKKEQLEAEQEKNEFVELKPDSFEQLQVQLEEITNEIYEMEKEKDRFLEKWEKLERTKEELLYWTKEREKKEKIFRIIEQTAYYLEKAKEQFALKYRSPVEDGFTKYMSYLGEHIPVFSMDTDMEIKIKEEGMLQEEAAFSIGWQDWFGVCKRMAMIDAMYSEEKPFLIWDDPFVNLDEEKMPLAMDLLEHIANEYQILYFTCHNTRNPLEYRMI